MIDQYQGLYQSYRWLLPSHFNIAQACCHRWGDNPADARRTALYIEDANGNLHTWRYGQLVEVVKQLANGLLRMGLGQGERIAVILGTRAETLIAHFAAYSVGAIVVPLSPTLAPDALIARLRDAQARIAIVDASCADDTLSTLERIDSLQQIISIDFHDDRTLPWRSLLARQSSDFRLVPNRASDPALLLYSDAPSSLPHGVVLSHAALIGNLPGFVATHDWFPQPDDVLWTGADWSSHTGLMSALLPSLYFGRSVVASTQPYQAKHALALMARHSVRCACLSPSEIGSLKQTISDAHTQHRLALRSIAVNGVPLAPELFDWCRTALDVTPNQSYGVIEANQIVGHSQAKWPTKSGSMGRAIPGHNVVILGDNGFPLSAGKIGEIAIARFDIHGTPDPVLFQGYWRNDAATQAHYSDVWLCTGDLAWRDENGNFFHIGRRSPSA